MGGVFSERYHTRIYYEKWRMEEKANRPPTGHPQEEAVLPAEKQALIHAELVTRQMMNLSA
jgi:hypothetical protein